MGTDTSKIEDRFRPSGWLLEAQTALSTAIERFAVSRTDYTATVLDLVARLRFAEEHTLRGVELGRQLSKTPGYVSRVIDRAEHVGLVIRKPDPDDRRAQLITLTRKGNRVFDEVAPYTNAVLEQTIYASLQEEEVQTLVRLLRKVADSANQLLETGLDHGSED